MCELGAESTGSGSQHTAADDVSGAVAPDGQGGVPPQLVGVAPLEAGFHPPSLLLQPPAAGDPEPAPSSDRPAGRSSRRVWPTTPDAGPPGGRGGAEGPQAVAVRRPDVHETDRDRLLQVAPPHAPPSPPLLLLCLFSHPRRVALPLPPGSGSAALRLVGLLGRAGGSVSEGGRLGLV